MKQAINYAEGFVRTTCWAAAIASALLFTRAAEGQPVKPPIRGLVSMGAFRFVGHGGEPVNTLEPLNAKPGIFGGIVIIAYKECLRNGLRDYAPWKSSRIVLSVNPLRTGLNQGPGDLEFTMGIMRECRRTLGVRCVFDNHNLDTKLPRPLLPLYALMKQLGPEIVFQTGGTNPKDFDGTIKKGVEMGATSIELWQDYGGFPTVPDAQLRRWAALIESNTTR